MDCWWQQFYQWPGRGFETTPGSCWRGLGIIRLPWSWTTLSSTVAAYVRHTQIRLAVSTPPRGLPQSQPEDLLSRDRRVVPWCFLGMVTLVLLQRVRRYEIGSLLTSLAYLYSDTGMVSLWVMVVYPRSYQDISQRWLDFRVPWWAKLFACWWLS